MKRLAIITTHPIQYNAPLFELLTERNQIQIKVFYTWGESVLEKKYDPGFGKVIEWDIPLLKGYDYQFLDNIAQHKGSHHFKGIDNPNIINEIDKYAPDGILVYGWSFKSHLKVMRHFKGKIPVIFRGDSTLLDQAKSWKNLMRRIALRWVYRHVDVALYVGKANYEYFTAMGLKSQQLIYAPHVVNNDRFSSLNHAQIKKSDSIRKQNDIAADDFVFLFAGKFETKKDPLLLCSAFQSCNFNKNVHLLMVGNGVLEGELKQKFGTCKQIHFMEFVNQSDMAALYHAADVFALPSKGPGETWGLAVNEAMAAGLACIVSDKCGCAQELIEHGKNGFVFESGNRQALADAMMQLQNPTINLTNMKAYSQEKIKKFTLVGLSEIIEKQVMELT